MIKDSFHVMNYFKDISEITMNSLKIYYLSVLSQIPSENAERWSSLYAEFNNKQSPKFQTYSLKETVGEPLRRVQSLQEIKPTIFTKVNDFRKVNSEGSVKHPNQLVLEELRGMLITTNDAYTLTDGPTLFLVGDVLRIGLFYVHHTKLPDTVLQQLMTTITKNEKIYEKIKDLEYRLQQKLQVKDNSDKSVDTKKKGKQTNERSGEGNAESESMMDQIMNLRSMIRIVSIEPKYIPNTVPHQTKWTPTNTPITNAFSPNISEEVVKEIMELEVDQTYKILALLGIGILVKQPNAQYEEIIKRLAHEQRLYLVLASSDFVYGTNYQFCHGFIGEDLSNMTAQKTLQAMGRVGRNNIQQEYTIRFRDDEMIRGLFRTPEINREAVNMCRLFCHE